jgi:hypothetical protein
VEVISFPKYRVPVVQEKTFQGLFQTAGPQLLPLGEQRIADGLGLVSKELKPVHPALFNLPDKPDCSDNGCVEDEDCVPSKYAAIACLCEVANDYGDPDLFVDFGVKCLAPDRR